MMPLFDIFFGCAHRQMSGPRTLKENAPPAAAMTGTYCVCLDCGKEFSYDLQTMKIVSPRLVSIWEKETAERLAEQEAMRCQ